MTGPILPLAGFPCTPTSVGTEALPSYRRAMDTDADLAAVAGLIGDPARARVLAALGDGRALAASVLAGEAGVSAPTVSGHLRKLVDAGILTVTAQGRHRYYRLASPEVAGRARGAGADRPAGAGALPAGGHPGARRTPGPHLL